MVVAGRSGIARCGLLDFQDAVIGPISYDLVSLLEDARRDVSPEVVTEMLARYQDALRPLIDRSAFAASYAALGAQRSEEHTSELQSLMRISYAVFCLKKKKQT